MLIPNPPVDIHLLVIHLLIVDLWRHELRGTHNAQSLVCCCQSQITNLYLAVVGIVEYIVAFEIPACNDYVPSDGLDQSGELSTCLSEKGEK